MFITNQREKCSKSLIKSNKSVPNATIRSGLIPGTLSRYYATVSIRICRLSCYLRSEQGKVLISKLVPQTLTISKKVLRWLVSLTKSIHNMNLKIVTNNF
jgi:hypothetical protein